MLYRHSRSNGGLPLADASMVMRYEGMKRERCDLQCIGSVWCLLKQISNLAYFSLDRWRKKPAVRWTTSRFPSRCKPKLPSWTDSLQRPGIPTVCSKRSPPSELLSHGVYVFSKQNAQPRAGSCRPTGTRSHQDSPC